MGCVPILFWYGNWMLPGTKCAALSWGAAGVTVPLQELQKNKNKCVNAEVCLNELFICVFDKEEWTLSLFLREKSLLYDHSYFKVSLNEKITSKKFIPLVFCLSFFKESRFYDWIRPCGRVHAAYPQCFCFYDFKFISSQSTGDHYWHQPVVKCWMIMAPRCVIAHPGELVEAADGAGCGGRCVGSLGIWSTCLFPPSVWHLWRSQMNKNEKKKKKSTRLFVSINSKIFILIVVYSASK